MSLTTTYTIHGDEFALPHTTQLSDVAEEWSRAGYRVTAEARGVGE